MPTEDTTPRRPPPIFVFDHGSIGFQCGPSAIEERWIEITIEDDEAEIVLVGTPSKLTAIGLNITAMVASRVAT